MRSSTRACGMSDAAVTPAPWRQAAQRFGRNRPAMAGLIVLLIVTVFCVFGPFVSSHDYDRVYPDYVKTPASFTAHPSDEEARPVIETIAAHMHANVTEMSISGDVARVSLASARPIDDRLLAYFERSGQFGKPDVIERSDEGRAMLIAAPIKRVTFLAGADSNGRDLLVRLMIGGRVSLLVGALASFVALAIGVGWGASAGYLGGRVDMVMMRIVDILYALPFIFFVILLIVFFGRHFVLIFVAIGAIEWLDMARIVRGQTLSLKRQEFVLAAEALGIGAAGIVRRHIVPNLAGPVLAYLTLLAPRIILLESFLSFLGLGVQEPMTSLGVLVSEGARGIEDAPGLLFFPALLLSSILFSLNFVGDGLRDALDPRER
jgi:oligopeptide transport system permease protein